MRNIMIFALLMACVGCETSHIDRYEEIQNRIDKRRRQREAEREQFEKERAQRLERIENEKAEKKANHKARVQKEIEEKYDVKVEQLVVTIDFAGVSQGKVEIDDNGERKVLTFRAQYDDEACIVEFFE